MTPVHQWLLKIRLAKAGSYHHTCKWCCLGLYLLAFKIKERYIKPVSTCHYIYCSCLNLQHNAPVEPQNPMIKQSNKCCMTNMKPLASISFDGFLSMLLSPMSSSGLPRFGADESYEIEISICSSMLSFQNQHDTTRGHWCDRLFVSNEV